MIFFFFLHLNGIIVYAYSKMELRFVFVNFCTKTDDSSVFKRLNTIYLFDINPFKMLNRVFS